MSDSRDRETAKSRKRRWLDIARNLIATAILVGFALYLWTRRGDLARVTDVSTWHVVAIVILIVIGWVVGGAQTVVVYRAIGVPLTIREGIQLTAAGAFANHLPMRAGAILRAYYLKNVHRLGYARFGGATGLRTLLGMIAAGLAGISALTVIALTGDTSGVGLLIVIFLALVVGPVLLLLTRSTGRIPLPSRLRQLALDFTSAFNELRRRSDVSIIVIVLVLIQYVLLGLRFAISAHAMGSGIEIEILMLMAPLATLMQFVAITPGAIGLREAVMGFISHAVGHTFSDGVLIGAIDRAVLLAVTAIFGGLSFRVIWRKSGQAIVRSG